MSYMLPWKSCFWIIFQSSRLANYSQINQSSCCQLMQLTHTLRFSVRLPTHIICWTLFFSGSKKFIYALMFCGESDPAAATSWHFEWMRRSHSEPRPLCLLLLVSFTFPKIILSFCLKRMRTEDEEEEKEKEEDREEEEWWRESGGGAFG